MVKMRKIIGKIFVYKSSALKHLKTLFIMVLCISQKLLKFLKNAHIVLFPSFGENFSMALLEVMALGRITITSSIPSFREVIIDYENGFIANDESEYIERIDYIF